MRCSSETCLSTNERAVLTMGHVKTWAAWRCVARLVLWAAVAWWELEARINGWRVDCEIWKAGRQ